MCQGGAARLTDYEAMTLGDCERNAYSHIFVGVSPPSWLTKAHGFAHLAARVNVIGAAREQFW